MSDGLVSQTDLMSSPHLTSSVRMDYSLLIDVLNDASFGTGDGELAYLALTSKVELPFRDRLALSLRKRVPEAIVAREWKERVDLAILSATRSPKILVELKALHAFDLLSASKRRSFRNAVDNDKKKLKRFVKNYNFSSAKSYVLVLVTACGGLPNSEYEGVIKYRKAIANGGDMTGNQIERQMQECFGTNPLAINQVMAGEAFGIPVRIHYALYGVSI